jgi:hypothetical protein
MKHLTAAAILFSTCAFCGCTKLFFQPRGELFADPADYGQRYEVIKFQSADGTELTGMFFRPEGKAAGTVVHFHGNAQNMTAHFPYSSWLAAKGFNVFIFDYRGYGASGGSVSVSGAVEDGVAAIAQVKKIPGVDGGKVAVFGQSLGGAVGVASAARVTGEPVAALVLDSTFYSYRGVASALLLRHWWGWPLFWFPLVAVSDSFSPGDDIGRMNCPKLFLHSENDPMVPFSQGKKLYAAAPEPKKFLPVPAGHAEAFTVFRDIYRPQMVEFLNAAFGKP